MSITNVVEENQELIAATVREFAERRMKPFVRE
jgi:hypothetical protein